MLNNPLKVLTPKMDNAIGTDDDLHCIRYSLLMPCASASVPTDWYLRVEKQSTTPVQALANVAITPSTFRKLGAGFVEAAQEFLASLNLKQLANLEPSEYPKWLEDQTQALMASFPLAERWGPARKSINIFMVMASLNQFLCDEYKLHRFGYVLEVPLDNTVTKKLRAWGKERNRVRRGQFPTFSIKQLKKADSDQYQELAQACAEERGIPRGRLDIELWEPQRQRRGEQLASQRLK